MTRKVAIVTGTRAEYGLLTSLMEACQAHKNLEAGFVVTGTHFQEACGHTVDDIRRDGFPIWAECPFYDRIGDDFDALPAALSAAIRELDRAFKATAPDMVVVLGDRLEALAGALAAYYRRIIVAHIHGGEKTDGHIDDGARHAITRLAHLHFPATEESAQRLRNMGEEDFRIHRCGAPGLDHLAKLPPATSVDPPFYMLLFHPETIKWQAAGEQTETIISALLKQPLNIVALYPNGDPGSSAIIKVLEKYASRIQLHKHMVRYEFLKALSTAKALIGNSSCGLIEACFLKAPVLHLGKRNRDREHGANVLFRPITEEAINDGLQTIQSPSFRETLQKAPCPWGDGRAGERMAAILSEVALDEALLGKKIDL